MPTVGIAILPAHDCNKVAQVASIFANSNILSYVTIAVEFRIYQTIKRSTYPLAYTEEPRLIYDQHAEIQPSTTTLNALITDGDQVSVLWISHGQYYNVESGKFVPHYNTDGPQAVMSAKELASTIMRVSRHSATNAFVLPQDVVIASCKSARPRRKFDNNGQLISTSEMSLASRVGRHLRSLSRIRGGPLAIHAPKETVPNIALHWLTIPIQPSNNWETIHL